MKRTILMLVLVGVALTACEKNDDYVFKSGEYVYLNGVDQPKFKSTATQYSIAEIVRNMDIVMWYYWNDNSAPAYYQRGFGEEMQDTINNRLLMRAEDILDVPDGKLDREFIDSKDIYLTIPNGTYNKYGQPYYDTCAYIPNSVIASARAQIEELYAQEKYDEIYELFHTAFTFYPCTGEEFKQILKNGGN